jgi:hypothetical protein
MTFAIVLAAVVVIAVVIAVPLLEGRERASKAGRSGGTRAWLAGEDAPPPPAAELAGRTDLAPESDAVGENSGAGDAAETDDDGEASWAVATDDSWTFEADGEGEWSLRDKALDPGQFVAARVARRHSSYWLEALGKEEIEAESGTTWPLSMWSFQRESDALAVLELLQRLIVRPPRDENGEPRAITDEDFERARGFKEAPLPDSGPAGDEAEPTASPDPPSRYS